MFFRGEAAYPRFVFTQFEFGIDVPTRRFAFEAPAGYELRYEWKKEREERRTVQEARRSLQEMRRLRKEEISAEPPEASNGPGDVDFGGGTSDGVRSLIHKSRNSNPRNRTSSAPPE